MFVDFIFSNLNIIMLVLWITLSGIIVMHFLRPSLLKNIHFGWIAGAVIALHILYGVFVTWAQYHVWATASDPRISYFVSAPLPIEAPLPAVLEWSRSYFEHPLGYFIYYSFGRIWLNIIELFVVAFLFYAIIKFWSFYRGGFLPQGPEIILGLLLISGFPGVLALVPLGFVLTFLLLGFYTGVSFIRSGALLAQSIHIEPAFLMATPIALIYGKFILNDLYSFLYTVVS